MKLCITILKQEEMLDKLLKEYKLASLVNITIINSNSIINSKHNNRKKMDYVIGTLRHLVNYGTDDSIVILQVVDNKEIDKITNILNSNVNKEQYLFLVLDIEKIDGII